MSEAMNEPQRFRAQFPGRNWVAFGLIPTDFGWWLWLPHTQRWKFFGV